MNFEAWQAGEIPPATPGDNSGGFEYWQAGEQPPVNSGNASNPPIDVYEIEAQLLIDWDHNGTYTDETTYFVEARGTHRTAPPGQSITATSGQVSQCTVIVDNTSGRFSSLNSSSAIYSNIQSGKMYHVPVAVNLSTTFGGTSYVRVFTGVARIPTELTLTTRQPKTLAIDCRGIEETLLNKRLRTTVSTFSAAYDALQTESDHFDDALTAAGLTVTTDYVLDDGLHNIPFFWIDNESTIEILWQTAAVCGGRFYGRQDGILAYENATHWLMSPHNAVQDAYNRNGLSGAIPFGSLELTWDETELAEEVTVGYTPRELAADATLWESETIVVAAGETDVVWGAFENPVYSITSLTSTAGSPGGGDLSASVTITPTYYASSVKLSIANAASVDAYVNIQIAGKPTSSGDSTQIVRTSADSYWTSIGGRTRSISGNKHLQSRTQAEMISNFLGERQENPPLVARMRGCPGNPNRTIGDKITIADTQLAIHSPVEFFVTAVTWRYSSRGYIQDIDAIRCSDLYPYLGSYFVIGTDTLGGGDRVFY